MQSKRYEFYEANNSAASLPYLLACLTLILQSISLIECSIASTTETKLKSKTQPDLNEVQLINENHYKFNEIRKLRNKCLFAESELDRCSAQLIGLGQSGPVYPDNMQELNSIYCPKFKDTVNCIRNNTDCYKPFERQIINWILTSTRRMNYKRCKDEGEKQRFLRLTSSCLSAMKNPMDDCMSHYVSSLDAIANFDELVERLSEDDIQIQLSCCANKRFKQCVMNSARQSCKPHESLKKMARTNSISAQRNARKQVYRAMSDTMDDLKSTLDGMALTGPGFICNNVDEKFCRTKFDGKFKSRTSRHKSILPAMIKIYSNK